MTCSSATRKWSTAWSASAWSTRRVAIESKPRLLASPALVALLAATQLISQRAFWTIPDFPTNYAHRWPLLTPLSSRVPYFDLYAFFRPFSDGGALDLRRNQVGGVATAEYLVLGAVLLAWLRWRDRRAAVQSPVRTAAGMESN